MSNKLSFIRRYAKRETSKRNFQIIKTWATPKESDSDQFSGPSTLRRRSPHDEVTETDIATPEEEILEKRDPSYHPLDSDEGRSDYPVLTGTQLETTPGEAETTPGETDTTSTRETRSWSGEKELSSETTTETSSLDTIPGITDDSSGAKSKKTNRKKKKKSNSSGRKGGNEIHASPEKINSNPEQDDQSNSPVATGAMEGTSPLENVGEEDFRRKWTVRNWIDVEESTKQTKGWSGDIPQEADEPPPPEPLEMEAQDEGPLSEVHKEPPTLTREETNEQPLGRDSKRSSPEPLTERERVSPEPPKFSERSSPEPLRDSERSSPSPVPMTTEVESLLETTSILSNSSFTSTKTLSVHLERIDVEKLTSELSNRSSSNNGDKKPITHQGQQGKVDEDSSSSSSDVPDSGLEQESHQEESELGGSERDIFRGHTTASEITPPRLSSTLSPELDAVPEETELPERDQGEDDVVNTDTPFSGRKRQHSNDELEELGGGDQEISVSRKKKSPLSEKSVKRSAKQTSKRKTKDKTPVQKVQSLDKSSSDQSDMDSRSSKKGRKTGLAKKSKATLSPRKKSKSDFLDPNQTDPGDFEEHTSRKGRRASSHSESISTPQDVAKATSKDSTKSRMTKAARNPRTPRTVSKRGKSNDSVDHCDTSLNEQYELSGTRGEEPKTDRLENSMTSASDEDEIMKNTNRLTSSRYARIESSDEDETNRKTEQRSLSVRQKDKAQLLRHESTEDDDSISVSSSRMEVVPEIESMRRNKAVNNDSLWKGKKISAVKVPRARSRYETPSVSDDSQSFVSATPIPKRKSTKRSTVAKKVSPKKPRAKVTQKTTDNLHGKSEEREAESRSVSVWAENKKPRKSSDVMDLDIALECLKVSEREMYEEAESRPCERATMRVCAFVRKEVHKTISQVHEIKHKQTEAKKLRKRVQDLRSSLREKQQEKIELNARLRKVVSKSGIDEEMVTLNSWLDDYDKLIYTWDQSKASRSIPQKYKWYGNIPEELKSVT